MTREKYLQYKADGICPSCKRRPAGAGRVQCEECAEEYRENRRYLKSLGICVQCRHEDAEPGKVLCWDCAEKARQAAKKRRENMTDDQRQRLKEASDICHKERRKKRIESGLCVICGKYRAQAGKAKCIDCRLRESRQRAAKKADTLLRSERPAYGLCYTCGQPAIKGKSVCGKCLAVKVANLANANRANPAHPWRHQNNALFQKSGGGVTFTTPKERRLQNAGHRNHSTKTHNMRQVQTGTDRPRKHRARLWAGMLG